MNRSKANFLAAITAAVILLSGCAGIEPYDPPNDKEVPPVNGLLTGKDGEFVINVKRGENESVSVEIEGEDRSGDKNP